MPRRFKGAGEAGTAGAPRAVLNAVNDALAFPWWARADGPQPSLPKVVLKALGRVLKIRSRYSSDSLRGRRGAMHYACSMCTAKAARGRGLWPSWFMSSSARRPRIHSCRSKAAHRVVDLAARSTLNSATDLQSAPSAFSTTSASYGWAVTRPPKEASASLRRSARAGAPPCLPRRRSLKPPSA